MVKNVENVPALFVQVDFLDSKSFVKMWKGAVFSTGKVAFVIVAMSIFFRV
jgi:hypothetical protein